MSSFQYLAIAQLATAFFLWLSQITVLHQVSQISNLTTQGFLAAMFVSVIACVLCYSVLYWLLTHVDGHKLALFDGVHALSAMGFGILFFGEKITALVGIAGLLILAGLLLGNYPDEEVEKQIE